MRVELTLSLATLYGFLLVLARVAGALAFVPIPGFKDTPAIARVVLALGLTVALLPFWPRVDVSEPAIGHLAAWLGAEAAFGLAVGIAVALLNEAFVLSSQVFGLQAGYGYASMIDPASEADSSVLQIFAHLTASMLFFAFGMDREVIRIFARSFEAYPAGSYGLSLASTEQILHLGSAMFATGVRLALPVVSLLMLVDIALALLGRINAQLQLLMLAFPAKMLASMAVLAAIVAVYPTLYEGVAAQTVRALLAMFGPEH
jgi:flagellar biosynthetic protein FliR